MTTIPIKTLLTKKYATYASGKTSSGSSSSSSSSD